MSDITKKEDILNKIKSNTLKGRVTDLRSKIEASQRFKGKVLLCDVSGSMSALLDSNENIHEHVTAIDVVNSLVKDFPGADVYEFYTHCNKIPKDYVMSPKGSTNLTGAFATVKSQGVKELVLLTDGAPDNPQEALRESQGLVLNIIYIGPAPTPDFLLKLGGVGSNKIDSVKLLRASSAKEGKEQIASKIKGFLGA
jgi:hypothetical protein